MAEYSIEDMAYAAGIIDGEGCIYLDKHQDKRSNRSMGYVLRVKVAMTDFDVPFWLEKLFGGWVGFNNFDNDPSRRPQAIWGMASTQAIEFLEIIEPYIKIKLPQTYIAYRFGETISKKLGRKKKLSTETLKAREGLYQKMRNANQRRA